MVDAGPVLTAVPFQPHSDGPERKQRQLDQIKAPSAYIQDKNRNKIFTPVRGTSAGPKNKLHHSHASFLSYDGKFRSNGVIDDGGERGAIIRLFLADKHPLLNLGQLLEMLVSAYYYYLSSKNMLLRYTGLQ